eukprot:1244437-Amphidinium_carterae.1
MDSATLTDTASTGLQLHFLPFGKSNRRVPAAVLTVKFPGSRAQSQTNNSSQKQGSAKYDHVDWLSWTGYLA